MFNNYKYYYSFLWVFIIRSLAISAVSDVTWHLYCLSTSTVFRSDVEFLSSFTFFNLVSIEWNFIFFDAILLSQNLLELTIISDVANKSN
jgi:hypothetical protein